MLFFAVLAVNAIAVALTGMSLVTFYGILSANNGHLIQFRTFIGPPSLYPLVPTIHISPVGHTAYLRSPPTTQENRRDQRAPLIQSIDHNIAEGALQGLWCPSTTWPFVAPCIASGAPPTNSGVENPGNSKATDAKEDKDWEADEWMSYEGAKSTVESTSTRLSDDVKFAIIILAIIAIYASLNPLTNLVDMFTVAGVHESSFIIDDDSEAGRKKMPGSLSFASFELFPSPIDIALHYTPTSTGHTSSFSPFALADKSVDAYLNASAMTKEIKKSTAHGKDRVELSSAKTTGRVKQDRAKFTVHKDGAFFLCILRMI